MAPGDELAAGLFDGLGKVGIQRRARAIWIVPESAREPLPSDAHRHARAPGRCGERAHLGDESDDLRTQLGIRVVGRPPSRRTPRPPLQSLCFSESSDTVPSLRCRYTTTPVVQHGRPLTHSQQTWRNPAAPSGGAAEADLAHGGHEAPAITLPAPKL
jgi:hypothetical protein